MRRFLPEILLAVALLGGTWLATQLDASGSWIMLAPLLVAVMTVVAAGLGRGTGPVSRRTLIEATIMGAIVMASCAIMAIRNPEQISTILPVVGGSALWLGTVTQQKRCGSTPSNP